MVALMLRQILLALTLSFAALPARAITQDEVLSASILAGWTTKDGTQMAALHLQLAPGWKTYWRAPGDAGIPPVFDWSASENVSSIRLHWPRPSVFDLNGMKSIGYHDDLVLPVEVTPIDPSRPILLRLKADLGVCKDICMPAALDIESPLQSDGHGDAAIRAALDSQPVSARKAGVATVTCQVEPIRDGLRVTADVTMPVQGKAETVVFESGLAGVWVSEAQTTRQGAVLTAIAEMVPPNGKPFALERGKVTLTVIGTDRAVEIRGCPAP